MSDSGALPSGRFPSKSRPFRAALILGAWMLFIFLWSYAARDLLPLRWGSGWNTETQAQAPPLARYDSGWYLGIAEHGYGPAPPRGQTSAHAFAPLYPALVGAAMWVFRGNGFVAGICVASGCFFLAGLLFSAEGLRRLGKRKADHALLFLLLFPTSFFLVSMYSESLFLLLALLAFDRLRRGEAPTAAIFGFLAGLTRLSALALALPLAIEAWRATSRVSRFVRVALLGAAPILGVLSWVLTAGGAAGEIGLVFRVQEAWHRGIAPISGLARIAAEAVSIGRAKAWEHPVFLLDYFYALLFLLICIFQARRRRFSDAAWTAGALVLPLSTGIAASLPRYMLVVYPAFFALAEFFDSRPRPRLIWWVLSAALLLIGEAAFVHWRWVA